MEGWGINILSVFNDKLLISCEGLSKLFIYSLEGRYLFTIKTHNNDNLLDAVWTPRGNIVYTADNDHRVVVMSEFGKFITAHTHIKCPRYLSVSTDGIIYLAGYKTGVYQSTDDGINWSLAFKSTDGWSSWQVIKVSTNHGDDDDFWTLEKSGNNYHLRVYSLDRRSSDSKPTWRDINIPTTDGKKIDLLDSRLLYDGNMNIFLSDWENKAVHVLSTNGQYHCQLMSSHHIKNNPYRLAVDSERHLLYVGQSGQRWGLVRMFGLMHGD